MAAPKVRAEKVVKERIWPAVVLCYIRCMTFVGCCCERASGVGCLEEQRVVEGQGGRAARVEARVGVDPVERE